MSAEQDSVSAKPSGRRKRPRVIAAPQQLPVKVELTGSYVPVPATEQVDRALAGRLAPSSKLPRTSGNPLTDLRAKDDDPRQWGDQEEDLAQSLKRDKPPHWG